jgi:hypothetical protein
MTTSVLRVADQRKGRVPDRCVVTGEPTQHAIRVRAARRPRMRWLYPVVRPILYLKARGRPPAALAVVLPLAPVAWRQRRNIVAASGIAGGAGGALIAFGATGHTELLVIGVLVVAAVVVARLRFDARRWVQVWLKPGGEEIIVTNTSPAFDEMARQLFMRRAPG